MGSNFDDKSRETEPGPPDRFWQSADRSNPRLIFSRSLIGLRSCSESDSKPQAGGGGARGRDTPERAPRCIETECKPITLGTREIRLANVIAGSTSSHHNRDKDRGRDGRPPSTACRDPKLWVRSGPSSSDFGGGSYVGASRAAPTAHAECRFPRRTLKRNFSDQSPSPTRRSFWPATGVTTE